MPGFLYDNEAFGGNVLVGTACVCGNARLQRAREEVEKADRLQPGTDVELLQRAADKIAEAEKLYAQLEAGIRSGAIAAIAFALAIIGFMS